MGFMNCLVAQSRFVAIVCCADSDGIILLPVFFSWIHLGLPVHVLSSRPCESKGLYSTQETNCVKVELSCVVADGSTACS